jgi:flagellar biogenesis protein FliO
MEEIQTLPPSSSDDPNHITLPSPDSPENDAALVEIPNNGTTTEPQNGEENIHTGTAMPPSDPTAPPSGSIPAAGSFFNSLFVSFFLFILILGIGWWLLRRLNRRNINGSARVLDRTMITRDASLVTVQVASDILLLGVTKEQVSFLQRWRSGDPDAPVPAEPTEINTGLFGQVKQALGFKNIEESAPRQQAAEQADFLAYLNRAQRQTVQNTGSSPALQSPEPFADDLSDDAALYAASLDPLPPDAMEGGVEYVPSQRPPSPPRNTAPARSESAADELLDRIAKRNERYKK